MIKRKNSTDASCLCACGASLASECCTPFLQGVSFAQTAEQLMRSRYSAFVARNAAYLLSTWHPDTRPDSLDLTTDQTRWLGLEVKDHLVLNEHQAEVEFVARFKEGGGAAHRLHERSRFERINGRWFYVDGDIR